LSDKFKDDPLNRQAKLLFHSCLPLLSSFSNYLTHSWDKWICASPSPPPSHHHCQQTRRQNRRNPNQGERRRLINLPQRADTERGEDSPVVVVDQPASLEPINQLSPMDPVRKDISQKYDALRKEWDKGVKMNVDAVGRMLVELKIALTQLNFLPTTIEGVDAAALKADLILARDVLEIGCLYAVVKRDIPSFERSVAQLKTYYFDFKDELPQSAFMYQVLGLNLLRLLSQNRLAEFHTELELLTPAEIQNQIYISHPVALEQYIMEGRYNKVFLSKGNVPAESYNFFLDSLLNTIRAEIAACIEVAYEKVTVQEAARMLYLSSVAEISSFIQAHQKNWQTVGNHLLFNSQDKRTKDNKTPERVPSLQLMAQTVGYAIELEKIV